MSFSIWAIADLHLAFGAPDKKMDIFGHKWVGYTEKIEKNWQERVGAQDLVLIAGDIAWAMTLEEALVDLTWIERLPGTKIMIKGNHDYWWHALSKVRKKLPPSCHVIQNDVFNHGDVSIGGSRLWDCSDYNFDGYISSSSERETSSPQEEEQEEKERVYRRELLRLETSLKQLNQQAHLRIAMTHYPPISADLKTNRATMLFEKYKVDISVFGHLHNVPEGTLPFGEKNGVKYFLIAGDYLDFKLLKIR